MKELYSFIEEIRNSHEVPGMAVGIIKNGEVIFKEGFGNISVSNDKKVDANTIFPVGSSTKSFTSMIIGMLVDEGLLDWDKPVKEYIPEFKLSDPYLTNHVTIKDLACHRTGIPRYKSMVLFNSSTTSEELLERISHFKPVMPFRTDYQYNNATYAVLGVIVERVTQKKWEEVIEEKIFKPLNIKNSNFSISEMENNPNHVSSHRKIDEALKEIEHLNVGSIKSAGSINSNLTDMLKWLQLQLDKGKSNNTQLISENTLSEMQSPHTVINKTLPCKEFYYPTYGLGWMIENYRGYKIVHHPGSTSGCQSIVTFMPSEGIGMVILTNKGDSPVEILTCSIYDRLLGLEAVEWNCIDRLKELSQKWDERGITLPEFSEKETLPSYPLEAYTGIYEHGAMGRIIIELIDDDTLLLKYGKLHMPSNHCYNDIFVAITSVWGSQFPMKVTFNKNLDGIKSLTIPLGWDYLIEDLVFEKLKPDGRFNF